MLNFEWLNRLLKRELPQEQPKRLPNTLLSKLTRSTVWAVGGGKGGVGKSLVASNIAIALSRLNKRVLIIDADLGAANLHTFLGTESGKQPLSAFLKNDVQDIGETITKTPIANLDLISGARDSLDAADIKGAKLARLKDGIKNLDYDYIVIDVGPGTTSSILDLFLMSHEGILTATPEPTTIENNYRFLKCLFLRKIRILADQHSDDKLKIQLQRAIAGNGSARVKTIADILNQVIKADYELGHMLKSEIGNTNISIVMNQARKKDDQDMGLAIRRACVDYFGVEINYLGSVAYEECVWESIRSRLPLVIHYKQSAAARDIESCMYQLMNKKMKGNTLTA